LKSFLQSYFQVLVFFLSLLEDLSDGKHFCSCAFSFLGSI